MLDMKCQPREPFFSVMDDGGLQQYDYDRWAAFRMYDVGRSMSLHAPAKIVVRRLKHSGFPEADPKLLRFETNRQLVLSRGWGDLPNLPSTNNRTKTTERLPYVR